MWQGRMFSTEKAFRDSIWWLIRNNVWAWKAQFQNVAVCLVLLPDTTVNML
jgi:hypothetical protein